MMPAIYDPSAPIHPTRNAPYNLSLATSASSSASSFWSDASSQHSDDTVSTAPTSYSDSCDSYYLSHPPTSSQISVSSLGSSFEPAIKLQDPWANAQLQPQIQVELPPAELRQNPRRTASSRSVRPPSLVRQSDRKLSFVENLVGKEHSGPTVIGHVLNPALCRHVDTYRRSYLAHLVGAASE
jgi:hypothetical protein